MMRHQVVFWVLLCHVHFYAVVQAQTAVWKFPLQGENIKANSKDSVLLDWTSTFPATILRIWCLNGTDGVTQDLVSSFFVNSTGPFTYILDVYDSNETSFPSICHAELAATPDGSGVDAPADITWHSDPAVAAATISQTEAVPSVTIAPSSTSTAPSSTRRSPSSPATSTPSIEQSTTSPGSPSNPTENPQPSTVASANNLGPKVGGAIGGLALLSFIILAVVFARKHRRKHSQSSPPKADAGGIGVMVFEKDASPAPYEKDATASSGGGAQISELQGSTAWKTTPSRL